MIEEVLRHSLETTMPREGQYSGAVDNIDLESRGVVERALTL